jgi:sirohydrochlorin cobaltochelatase
MAVGHRDQVMSRKGLLLVGHGSKLPYNKELVEETARLIGSRRPEFVVRCGFMSMNTPSVEDALADFRKDDVDAIVVVPLFLAKGVHINKDIPQILGLPEGSCRGSFQKNHASIPLVYADPIGSDPLLADLMLKNAERAMRDHL